MEYPIINIPVYRDDKGYTAFKIFDADIYKYADNNAPKWQLKPETTTILNYHCHKAIGNMGGREWTLYYTKDIPLPYGPYKFGNLPGLVTSAEDSTGSYIFKMVGVEKANPSLFHKPSFWDRAIATNKKKVIKAFKNFLKDPAKKLKQNIVSYPDGGYLELANPLPVEYVKRKEKELIEYYKVYDNYIEKLDK